MPTYDTFTLSVGAHERQLLLDALAGLTPAQPSLLHMRAALVRRLARLVPDEDAAQLVAGKIAGDA